MRNAGRFVTRSTLAFGRPALRSSVTPSVVPGTGAAERPLVGRSRSLAVAGRRVLTVLATILVTAMGAGATAFADDGVVRAETTSTGFGMLGPVGLVAVGFGVIGMALGVVRQRRKARAQAIEAVAAAEAREEEPARPLEPAPAALNLRQS